MMKKLAAELIRIAKLVVANSIFVIHVTGDKKEPADEYKVALSVHDNPRLGFQILKKGIKKNQAEAFAKQMKTPEESLLRFEETGYGHKRKYKKVNRF